MDSLAFRYKAKPWVMLAAALFFAVCGGFMVMEALTNERGLVIQRLVQLSPQGAIVFFWSLAVVCALFVLAGLAGFVASLLSDHYVRLTATELSAPKFAWSKRDVVVHFADIRDVTVQSVQNQRFLNVYHRQGKLSINQSFLPSREAFEKIYETVVARTRGSS